MKKNIALYIVSFFMLTSCWSEDDSSNYKNINLNIPNLIQFETQPTFNINDYVYFNINFSRYLPEQGYSDLLDIYKTTGATNFIFNFNLYKKSAYNIYEKVNFSTFYILDKGAIENTYYSNGFALYNDINKMYEFRAGIQLLEQGNYKLEIEPYINPINQPYHKNIYLSIYSVSNSNDFTNEYFFQVN